MSDETEHSLLGRGWLKTIALVASILLGQWIVNQSTDDRALVESQHELSTQLAHLTAKIETWPNARELQITLDNAAMELHGLDIRVRHLEEEAER